MQGRRLPMPDSPVPTDPIESLCVSPTAGFTVREVARRYRVGEDKVRAWIRRGELRAINTAATACARPRFVVPPEALGEFEQRRAGALPRKPSRRRTRRFAVDYYP